MPLCQYFPVPYGSWICCAEAFALDARNQIAARAIGEQIARKVRVLAFQNRACELLRPRCRIVVARAVRALPIRTCPFAARTPRAVRYGGEGTAEPPFERELLVPARPRRRPEQAPCWKVVIPTAGRLHGRAGAISRSDGLRCALVPSPPHLTAHGTRRARDERARTYGECPDRAGDYDSTSRSRSQKLAGTFLESQDTDLSNAALVDSAGGYLVACIERESFRTAHPRTIGNGEVPVY